MRDRFLVFAGILSLLFTFVLAPFTFADDWTRFRGSDGSARSDDRMTPTTWSGTQNLKWRTPLPGRGASSPIVCDGRVYVTCFTGADEDEDGSVANMKRHLLAVDRESGTVLWNAKVPADKAEDAYTGFVKTHGYASHTPVTDGERIYAFFGKSGVIAFDTDGAEIWRTDVGKETCPMRRGSSASPILYRDYVIVTASDESESVRALDKRTGKEVWKVQAAGLDAVYSTPSLITTKEGAAELVVVTPAEVWGLNPDTGKLRWYSVTIPDGATQMDSSCTSAAVHEGVVFVLAARSGNAAAIRTGGKGDVTDTHVTWSSRLRSIIPSPIYFEERLYWIDDRGIAHCADALTGKEINKVRLRGYQQGGGRSPFDSGFYASVVRAGDKLYATSRSGGTFVIEANPDLKQLAHNRFESDQSEFNGSPALSDDEIFLRSDEHLYCISARD